MVWHPAYVVRKYMVPPEQGDADMMERVGSWGDPAFVTETLTSAGFDDVGVKKCDLDVAVPAEADIPASLLIGMVDAAQRDAALADWRRQRESLTRDGKLQLDLRMHLITARRPN
ncbi:MAG: hypothetical protein QGG24_06890 [Vicinamibacterales bacterium]|nr:hypothetical protein [Vicinamibacterales bacterium]MDP7671201.1 hypothetical protein [Vicinamibacterales bacterium]HJO38443.1 hypothetical protein [Vicinamibacterales bacterium]